MARRTPEEARQALLDAAALQLQSQLSIPDLERALSLLDLNAISRDAGYRGTSMIYSLWGDDSDDKDNAAGSARERFSRDVVAECVDRSLGLRTDSTRLIRAAEEIDLSDPVGMIRDLANQGFRDVLHDDETSPWQVTYLWAITLAGDPLVGARLAELHTDSSIHMLGDAYEAALAYHGRRLRPGVTPLDFAMMLRALSHGLMIEHMAGSLDDSYTLDMEDLPGWTLFAVGLRGLMLGLSDPIPADTEPE